MEKSYLKGIVGAFLGGLIATIPWILVYVYGDMILSLLAIIVAMGALKGYQLFDGKIDKKLPTIITVVSLISITVATLLIIPGLLVVENDGAFTIENIKFLYSNSEFVSAMLRDYGVSVLFTFLGISGVIKSIKEQINNSFEKEIKIDITGGNNKKDKEHLRNILINKNAVNEASAIDLVNEEYNINTLNYLIINEIIIKKDNKYYYSLENEVRFNKRNKKIIVITVVLSLLFMGLAVLLALNSDDDLSNDDNQEVKEKKDIEILISDDYLEYIDDEEEYGWIYVPKDDLSGNSGYIFVYYFENEAQYSEDWAIQVKDNLEKDGGKVLNYEYSKNNHDLEVLSYTLEMAEYTDYIYYIFGNNGYLGAVEVIDYQDDTKLQEDGQKVVDNFKWLN